MTVHQTLTTGRHARILDNAAGYQGGIGRIIETADGKVAILIGTDVVWTENTKVQPGRFVDGQFTADADVETITMSDPPPRDVPGVGPARDGVVEGIERATGLNGQTLLERLADQGLTVVTVQVEHPELCQVPADEARPAKVVMAHQLLPGDENPLEAVHQTLAFSSTDWAAHRSDAWLYGIVIGWDNDPDDHPEDDGDDGDAMAELAAKHRWNDEAVARLRRLHAAWVALEAGV